MIIIYYTPITTGPHTCTKICRLADSEWFDAAIQQIFVHVWRPVVMGQYNNRRYGQNITFYTLIGYTMYCEGVKDAYTWTPWKLSWSILVNAPDSLVIVYHCILILYRIISTNQQYFEFSYRTCLQLASPLTGVISRIKPSHYEQNCRHFADDIFKHIFLNENSWILIEWSLFLRVILTISKHWFR